MRRAEPKPALLIRVRLGTRITLHDDGKARRLVIVHRRQSVSMVRGIADYCRSDLTHISHTVDSRAFSLAEFSAGSKIPARMAIIAIVTRSSIRVNLRNLPFRYKISEPECTVDLFFIVLPTFLFLFLFTRGKLALPLLQHEIFLDLDNRPEKPFSDKNS